MLIIMYNKMCNFFKRSFSVNVKAALFLSQVHKLRPYIPLSSKQFLYLTTVLWLWKFPKFCVVLHPGSVDSQGHPLLAPAQHPQALKILVRKPSDKMFEDF
jgi:hypothetical protein